MRIRTLGYAGVAMLATSSTAHACGVHISTTTALIPGAGFLAPWVPLTMAILYGFIERPIYSAAGYRTNTLWYSLQANFLTMLSVTLTGLLVAFVTSGPAHGAGPAIAITILITIPVQLVGIKVWWMSGVPRERDLDKSLSGTAVLGTAACAVVTALLPIAMEVIGTSGGTYSWRIRSIQPFAYVLSSIAAVAVVVVSFARAKRTFAAIERHGFEVIIPGDLPAASAQQATSTTVTAGS